MSVTQVLKTRTVDLHERIEGAAPLADPGLTIAGYADYLERLFPFYACVEAELDGLDGLRDALPDLDERWKTELLALDLKALGVLPQRSMDPALIPELRSVPQALGCLYVLEGSTLGGQILIRMVKARLGQEVAGKTLFLTSYGESVGSKWRRLGEALDAALMGSMEQDAAVESARNTFTCLLSWLVESRELKR